MSCDHPRFGDDRLPPRFWDKVAPEPNTGCWLWTAAQHRQGYGNYYHEGKVSLSHRVAYQVLVGPIPEGLVIDHRTCSTEPCVNPAHMEPVLQRENVRRGNAGKHMADKTHCPQGHPYSGDNLRVQKDGARVCITCARRNGREHHRRKRRARC